MTATTTLTTALAAKLGAYNVAHGKESVLKMRFAREIESCVKAAKTSGATLAEIKNIVFLLGGYAQRFAERPQAGGMWVGTVEDRQGECENHRRELILQLDAVSSFASYIGQPADHKYHIDALLSYSFERNEEPLSDFFRFTEFEGDGRKISKLDEMAKFFLRLQIAPAVNLPGFDQRFIDAGRC